MSKQKSLSKNSNLPVILISILMAISGLFYFAGHYKLLTALAGVFCLYLLLRRDLTPLRSIPALLFLSYAAISGLTRIWAISGKFFLKEFSEVFVAITLFLAVILCQTFDRKFVRSVMQVMAGFSFLYSVLSVEAATFGLSKKILVLLTKSNYASIGTGFEAGTRLTGIIGNANVLSSILAFGIICSICLLCGEQDRKTQLIYSGIASVNAFVFLLLFSMGGTACFILSVLVYLLFAGKKRSSALVRMLECAIPTVAWVFVAFPFFNQSGAAVVVPLCAMIGNAVTVILLEKTLGERMSVTLSGHEKLTLAALAGVIALGCAYVALGVTLTGAYTFGGEELRRGAYPESGTHILSIEASAPVNVTIISQDMSQVMMHTNTVLYEGSAENASFTVPENSEVCYFTFTAEAGTVLEEAALDSGESLKLKYTLLPGFIANRLQGLFANQNAIQRTVFFRDGMKMFYNSPIVGNGIGSFETGITSVQEFMYTTKYIHNHYIQILLEAGILGLLPFAGGLVCLIWLLFKRRKNTEWEFSAEYPALWAALVMTLTHMAVELSMSIIVFVWMAFVLFALIIRCCEAPVSQWKPVSSKAFRATVTALPAVFLLTLCCNMGINYYVRQPSVSREHYFQKLELTAVLDPYEANDAMLSYVIEAYNGDTDTYIPKANEYAAKLLTYQSNTIPAILLEYYLYTEQYDQAFQAAKAAAIYSASNHDTWNEIILAMTSHLLNNSASPLPRGDHAILDNLLNYYDILKARNSSSMEPIALNPVSKDFFSRSLSLAKEGLTSYEAATAILYYQLFDSSSYCDADSDLIPDQVVSHSGVVFGEQLWEFSKDSYAALELLSCVTNAPATISIQCQNPGAITVLDHTGAVVNGSVSDGLWTGDFLQTTMNNPVYLTIYSSAPQQLSHIRVISSQ